MPGAEGTVLEKAAPFLRWAGGKRWLLPRIVQLLGETTFSNYHEPFLGGASILLGLAPKKRCFLSDLNAELVETYQAVRDHPAKVARLLAKHPNALDHYYSVRKEQPSDPIERAARFIYLNHTSFNGIYRVNLNGAYNVPFGNRDSPQVPSSAALEVVAGRLKGAAIDALDFEEAAKRVRKKDLVFLDPPYTVAHNHNGFIKYNQKLFSFQDQQRLRSVIDKIRSKGAYYVLTNAAHQSISDLFDSDDAKFEVTRRNVIGGKEAQRGTATEFLFTNLPGAHG